MSEPTVSVTMAEPMSADDLWNSIMNVDDFIELLAGHTNDFCHFLSFLPYSMMRGTNYVKK